MEMFLSSRSWDAEVDTVYLSKSLSLTLTAADFRCRNSSAAVVDMVLIPVSFMLPLKLHQQTCYDMHVYSFKHLVVSTDRGSQNLKLEQDTTWSNMIWYTLTNFNQQLNS